MISFFRFSQRITVLYSNSVYMYFALFTRADKFEVYLGVRTWELFLCFVASVRVRVYYVDFFVFFVLRHAWVSQVLTPRQSPNSRYQIVSPEFYFLYMQDYCILRRMLFTLLYQKSWPKLLYLSDRSMRRMTNAVSWNSVQNLCLAIKSMFSTTSCLCNLGSLKYTCFFLNER